MTIQQKDYNPAVSHLMDKLSYGTLGVVNTLVVNSNDAQATKKNVFLVNVATVVRNVLNQKVPDREVVKAVSFEVAQLRTYFSNYNADKSHMVFYFQPNVYEMIPETSRRTITDTRQQILDYSTKVMMDDGIKLNRFETLGSVENTTYHGLFGNKHFIYFDLVSIINKSVGIVPKACMMSHCTLDYFVMDHVKDVVVIDSHTGRITEKAGLGLKVFKDGLIPFNRTTLKLFGDSEYISPLVRRNTLGKFGNIKLRTEREIAQIAIQHLNVESKKLHWKI